MKMPALLQEILSQPSVSFREEFVKRVVLRAADRKSVPHFEDRWGNLVLGAASPHDYAAKLKRRTREPLRLFVAHMDHPGFHGARWATPRRLEFEWHGGGPTRYLRGAPVWICDGRSHEWRGRLGSVAVDHAERAILRGVVQLDSLALHDSGIAATELFGAFQFKSFVWRAGTKIYTKAADDLVGTYIVAALALEAGASENFIGLLTRGEEVAYLGAIGHFRDWFARRDLRARPTVCVSVETSRALPGAEVGRGPVVRLGDKTTVFDPAWTRQLIGVAETTLPGRHQVRLMNGGTCEATAALAHGLAATGLSVPLGNYHNVHFEGAPNSSGPGGPAPEFVDLRDVRDALKLARAFWRTPLGARDAWSETRAELAADFDRHRDFLLSTRRD